MAKVTRRQKQFLSALLQLHKQTSEAVHYSQVADVLGVGNVTAYEMLRLLEERGLVEAEYQRLGEGRGPGRSTVLFRPTPSVAGATADKTPADWALIEWERAKRHLLRALRENKTSGYESLFEELVSRLQDQRSPIEYLTEMVTAILLGLNAVKEDFEARGLRGILRTIGFPDEGGLSALAGLGAGLSLVEQLNQHITDALFAQVNKYQQILSELSAENRRRLADFTQEVLEIVGG